MTGILVGLAIVALAVGVVIHVLLPVAKWLEKR